MDPDRKPDPVAAAFAELVKALGENALSPGGDFDRASAYRIAALRLAQRWNAGVRPHTPRGGKAEGS